jgi:hypothetical protein
MGAYAWESAKAPTMYAYERRLHGMRHPGHLVQLGPARRGTHQDAGRI